MSKEAMTDETEKELFDLINTTDSGRALAFLLGKLSVNGSVSVEDFKEVLIKSQVVED